MAFIEQTEPDEFVVWSEDGKYPILGTFDNLPDARECAGEDAGEELIDDSGWWYSVEDDHRAERQQMGITS